MSESTGPRAGLAEVSLPVSDLNAALPHLRRPFSAEAVKFKVQSTWPKKPPKAGAVLVAYIDARLVIERLNAVAGEGWTAEYAAVGGSDNMLRCDLTVLGVTRRDVGSSTKGMSKDLISDALKRAAVHFGVGVSVYALPQWSWRMADSEHLLKVVQPGSQYESLGLKVAGHTALRDAYVQWLDAVGEPAFGPVLDHGDVVSVLEPEAEVEEPDGWMPPAPEALTSPEAEVLRDRAKAVYTQMITSEAGRKAIPPARFDAWLRQASHSIEALTELVAHLEIRKREVGA